MISWKMEDNAEGTLKQIIKNYTVEPVYYGHLETIKRCPDYQGVLIFQVSYIIRYHLRL